MLKLKMTFIFMGFVLLSINNAFAHKEWVHQYLAKESYKFLENQIGFPVTDLKEHIGLNFYGNGGPDDDPWHTGLIAVGAWREDMEDVIWFTGSWGEGWTPSSTHFWNGDLGDDVMTPVFLSGNAHNAYEKARIFLFGGHRIFFAKKSWSAEYNQVILGRYYSYNSLVELFNTGRCYFEGYMDIAGNSHLNSPQEISLSLGTAHNYAYIILGRVVHLLTDLGVPAHAHADLHPCDVGDSDGYEMYMGNPEGCNGEPNNGIFPAQNWTAITAAAQGGLLSIHNDYSTDYEFIRFLFYTMQQLADHFPSGRVTSLWPGNNNLPNGTNYYIANRYQILGSPPSQINYTDIANECINFSIRATATLYAWFAQKTGQMNPPPPPGQLAVSISGPTTIDWGAAGESTWNASVSGGNPPYHYQWWYKYPGGLEELSVKTKNKKIVIDDSVHEDLLPSGYWSAMYVDSPTLTRYDYKDHYLKCVVTDADNTEVTSNIMYITVSGGSATQSSILAKGEHEEIDMEEVISKPQITEDKLFYNYPNPFNPSTVIYFTLKSAGNVNLKVYNILGQEVAVLLNGFRPPGRYNIRFNGENLPSGVYVYKLTSDNYSAIRKMNLMK